MRLTELINKHYKDLSETEKGIYQYIAQNQKEIINMSIMEFARESLSSKSSVIRFCQKLGFTGYSEMRNFIKWNLELSANINEDYSFFDQVKRDTEKLVVNLNDDSWNEIYDQIYLSDSIYIIVTGESQRNQALEMQRLLTLSGKNSGILFGNQQSAEFKQISYKLDKHDFVVILSLSGENQNLEAVVNDLKSTQVTLLSITNYSSNWLSKNCNYNLYARSSKSPEINDWWLRTTSTFFVLIESLIFGYNDYLRKQKMKNKS